MGQPSCDCEPTAGELERKGFVWIAVSFIVCPCHLPLTLYALALLGSGTWLAVLLKDHIIIIASVLTLLWGTGTWWGFRYLHASKIDGSKDRVSILHP